MGHRVGVVFLVCLTAGASSCGPEPSKVLAPPHAATPPPSASASSEPEPPERPEPVEQPARCSVDGYCWESPAPGMGPVNGLWAASDHDVYVLSASGQILRFDGSSWRLEGTPATGALACLGGAGPDDVLAAGDSGLVLRRKGGVWRAMPGAGDTSFRAVWGSPSGDVFAAGDGAAIAHHDGREWLSEPTGTKAGFSALWGTGAADLYAVGADDQGAGVVFHRDATGWRALPKVGKSLLGVWGTGPDAVWVAGTDGRDQSAVWRLSGSQWKAEDLPSGGEPRAFSGAGGAPVLLGVEYLDAERQSMGPTSVFTTTLDGGRWAKREVLLASPLLTDMSWTLHGDARGGLFVAGGWGVVGVIDGAGLRGLSGNAALGKNLKGVWGTSPTDVVAVGAEGALLRYDGKAWSPDPLGKGLSFTDIHGAKEILVASALGGRLLVRRDGTWTPLATGTKKDLLAVWTDGDDIFAAGDEGVMVRCTRAAGGGQRPDAARRCSTMKSGVEDPIYALAGAGPKDLYAATSGSLYHFDGVKWRRVPGPGEPGVVVIDPDPTSGVRHEDWVLHVSAITPDPRGGMIVERTDGSYRLLGGKWTRLGDGGAVALTPADASTNEIRAVYGGCAVGTPTRVRRFDGAAWRDEALPLPSDFDARCLWISAIWSNAGEVFVVGDGGVILHRKP